MFASPLSKAMAVTAGAVTVLVCLISIWYFFLRTKSEHSENETNRSAEVEQTSSSQPPTPEGINESIPSESPLPSKAKIDHSNEDPRFTRYRDGAVIWHQAWSLSQTLHQAEENPLRDLEIIANILGHYRALYRENPVGVENSEIVAALQGGNHKKVFFLAPSAVTDGQLLDRWGAPYRFHSISSQIMDLHSRGPDGKLWTQDDLTLGSESE